MATINPRAALPAHLLPTQTSSARTAPAGDIELQELPRPQAAAGVPQAQRQSGAAWRQRLSGSAPVQSAANAVVGVSDQGVAVIGGQLHVWRGQQRAWTPCAATGIAGVKLGANNDQVWALGASGALHRVGPDGALSAGGSFQLPAGVRDFALSPTAARVSYITAQGALMQQGRATAAEALVLPEGFGGAPVALAQTRHGDLYVAASDGQVWVTPPSATGAGEPAWTRIATAPDAPAPSQPQQLQILRDGRLGALDADGQLYRFDRLEQAWGVTGQHTDSEHRQAFERRPDASSWNRVGLNAAPLAYAQLGLPSSTPGVAGHGDYSALQDALQRAMDQLSLKEITGMPTLPALPDGQREAITAMLDGAADGAAPGHGVDESTARALASLEQPAYKLPRATDGDKAHQADKNTLQALYNFRSRVLKRERATDPVQQQLADLLRRGVYLPLDRPETMVLMGKVLADHALIKQAIDRQDDTRPARPSGAAALLTLEDAARIDVLSKSDMGGPQFKRINAASSALNAGLGKLNAGMQRTLGPLDADDPAAVGARFAEQVGNLQPGKESITLSFERSLGFDLEGLWAFFNLSADTIGVKGKHVLSANKLPIVTPLATASHDVKTSLEISRTDSGVQVVVSDGSTTSGSLGGRLQVRLGGVWQKANDKVTLIAVSGVEGAVIPGGSTSDMHSVAMHFNDDDQGRTPRLLADLYSGSVSLMALLAQADQVSNTHGESLNLHLEAYTHVFAALRANYGAPTDKLPEGNLIAASNLVVPALDQLAGRIDYNTSTRVTSDQLGNTRHHASSGVSGSVDFNHISVVDVSTWLSIPLGNNRSTEIQWKVPLMLAVFNRNLWHPKLAPQEASVLLAADGSLAGASVTVATQEALLRSQQADRPLTAELFPQLSALRTQQPGLGRFIDQLNASPSLRPALTFELTPAALDTLRGRIAALAQSGAEGAPAGAELVKMVKEAMCQSANLRLARIDVAAVRALPQQSILAFGPLRAARSQSHTFAQAGSSIALQYDPVNGEASGFEVEGKTLLGPDRKPDLDALASLGKPR